MEPIKIRRPKELENYIIKNCAIKAYLIFDKKNDICTCTRCGAKKKVSRMNDREFLVHNETHFCYSCDTKVICKEKRYGRKNLTEYGRILFFTRRGKTTFAQLDEFILKFDKPEPYVLAWTSAQYKFNAKEQIYHKHIPAGYWSEERWELRKNIKLPQPCTPMFQSYSKYVNTFLYEPSRRETGTDLRYANLDMSRFSVNQTHLEIKECEMLICYIYNFLKYQSIELLEKAGLENIVGDKVDGLTTRAVNWRGKNIRKILKLNNNEIKYVRDSHYGIYDFERFKKGREYFPWMSYKDADYMYKKATYQFPIHKETIEGFMPWQQAANYLFKQFKKNINVTYSDYSDYLVEANLLGLNMNDKKIIKPEDLLAAHRETSNKVQVLEDGEKAKAFTRSQRKITEMTEPYYYGEYLIRPAESHEELNKESQALHHCVRTYFDRVAKGRTSILFIREKNNPDKPLYTLELSCDHKVVQCRGMYNCAYPKDVQIFIDNWMQNIINKKKKAA